MNCSGDPLSALKELRRRSSALLLYRPILASPPGQAFVVLLERLSQVDGPSLRCLEAYGHWFYQVMQGAAGWRLWVISQVLECETPVSRWVQHQQAALPAALAGALAQDLQTLRDWVMEAPLLVQAALEASLGMVLPWPESDLPATGEQAAWVKLLQEPGWEVGAIPELAIPTLLDRHRRLGTGLLAQWLAFRWHQGRLVGIAQPDAVELAELTGYEPQKQALLANTEGLLAGQQALNVLLYGSRGAGKSALVKALLTRYGDRGLRLVEISKSDLIHLPEVIEQVRTSPLKFVIFVDDLSFEEHEDSYKALKVVLEGNLTNRPRNVVVYATSNRRHLIREFLGDRPRPSSAAEVHAWDTVQEKLSLSDRFGLTLTFEPADQETYLAIVHHLAQRTQIDLPIPDLTQQALQWATRHNGRSGRSARQFVDFLKIEKDYAVDP